MAFFPASPQYGKDVYGNPVPHKDKKGRQVYSKAVNTDDWVKDGKGGYRPRKARAKTHALKKKTSTADHINAERKRQGYKPMSAKDKRIHEGMDKYL